MINAPRYEETMDLISLAVKEDLGSGDVTSEAIFTENDVSAAAVLAKDEGVFCGSDMAVYVYRFIDPRVSVTPHVQDGMNVTSSTRVLSLDGPTRSLLAGERIMLNFLQRLSGIATRTAYCVSLLRESGIQLLDTRKTLPGFRALDKYAVACGGGTNHRYGLYDMVMIKDNHIRAAGSIVEAVRIVREKYGERYPVEVETTDMDEIQEALRAGADIIMLDNMDRHAIVKASEAIRGRAKIEVSGNMDPGRIRELADCGIDYISAGMLTHSVTAFDLSMKFI